MEKADRFIVAQQQFKTGGYGPEYGRSLGGVLSVTTKRGTNEWKGGANVTYTPQSQRAKDVYGERGASSGSWGTSERPGSLDDLQANLWMGAPLIQDKLFIFDLVQGADWSATSSARASRPTTSRPPRATW